MDSFSFRLYISCVNRANELGYEIILIHYNAKIHNTKTFTQLISERNLDGAIIQGFDNDDPFCEDATASSIPVVFIDVKRMNAHTTYVCSDICKAVNIGFSYLLSQGHTNFCFVYGSDKSWITKKWLMEVELFKKKNFSKIESLSLLNGDYSSDITKNITKKFYSSIPNRNTTALFATSDVMAIGAMKALHEIDLEVPHDVSVLGYDNIILAEFMSPSLTTISQNISGVASNSIDSLISLINGISEKEKILDVSLIQRESVGKRP